MSTICSNCKSVYPDYANYCRSCGTVLQKSHPTTFSSNKNNTYISYLLRHPELHLESNSEFQVFSFGLSQIMLKPQCHIICIS